MMGYGCLKWACSCHHLERLIGPNLWAVITTHRRNQHWHDFFLVFPHRRYYKFHFLISTFSAKYPSSTSFSARSQTLGVDPRMVLSQSSIVGEYSTRTILRSPISRIRCAITGAALKYGGTTTIKYLSFAANFRRGCVLPQFCEHVAKWVSDRKEWAAVSGHPDLIAFLTFRAASRIWNQL